MTNYLFGCLVVLHLHCQADRVARLHCGLQIDVPIVMNDLAFEAVDEGFTCVNIKATANGLVVTRNDVGGLELSGDDLSKLCIHCVITTHRNDQDIESL